MSKYNRKITYSIIFDPDLAINYYNVTQSQFTLNREKVYVKLSFQSCHDELLKIPGSIQTNTLIPLSRLFFIKQEHIDWEKHIMK